MRKYAQVVLVEVSAERRSVELIGACEQAAGSEVIVVANAARRACIDVVVVANAARRAGKDVVVADAARRGNGETRETTV